MKLTLYIPIVLFEAQEEGDKGVCDFLLQAFISEEDARILHPDAEIVELCTEVGLNPSDN